MNIKNTFSSGVKAIALSLGISAPVTSAQSQTLQGFEEIMQYQKQLLDSGASRCFSDHDFREYFNGFHIVKAGENISLITLSHGFSYEHLLQILQNIPESERQEYLGDLDMDTPSRIRPGDRIPLLDASYIHRYRRYESQYELQAQHNRIIQAWENNDTAYLDEHFSFQITPNLPQNLGIRRSYEALSAMFSQGYLIGPRSIYPINEDTPKCAETIKNTLKTFLGFQVNDDFQGLYNVVRKPDLDAWILPQELEEVGYIRPELLDARDLFNKNFHNNRIAIPDIRSEGYKSILLRQLEFLRSDRAVGCIIPTLYQHTATAQTVFGTYHGNEPNSHLFSCSGYSASPGFRLSEIGLDEEGVIYGLDDVLVSIVKHYGVIGGYKYQSPYSILNSLKNISNYIDIEIYDENTKEFVKLQFSENLSLMNDINIQVSRDTIFRIGGNILTDGYQVGIPDPWMNKKRMEQRLTPDWIIYASHFFRSSIFHPTSILRVPPSLLDPENLSSEEYISNQIPIQKFLDTNLVEKGYNSKGRVYSKAEDPSEVYKNAIAQEEFGENYGDLDTNQQGVVTRLYSTHSLGLQMLGYHSFGGVSWNPGSTNINAPIPYLRLSEEKDRLKIRSLYSEYITARKIDYYSLLRQEYCTDLELPFLRVRFFPGDTLTSAVYQLYIQLRRTNPWLSRQILNLDQIKRIHFVNILLGERISQGNIAAGEGFRIGREEVFGALRQVNHGIFQNDFELMDSRGNISFHAELIESVVDNPDWVLLMKYILANESYVNNSDGLNNIMYRVLRVEGLSRRGAKNTLYDLRESGITDLLNNEVLPLLTDFRIPTTSSRGDFQMRFPNLYVQNYISQWPARDLTSILREIRDESGRFSEDISLKQAEFPDIVRSDLLIVEEILAILEYDHERVRGREVAEKLRSLMRYDPGNTSNIIGFIISTHLAYELLQENIENFVHLLTLSGVSIADLNADEQARVMAATARCFNMGAKVCQIAFSDIYVNRFLEGLNEKYDIGFEFPQVERTGGVRNQKIYRRFIFINRHLPAYLEFIEQIERNHILSDVEKRALEALKNAFVDIQDNPLEYQNVLFRIFGDSDIQEGLKSLGLDGFILPTQEENAGETTDLARTLLADYANPEVIENRVQKPVTTNAEKFAVLGSLGVFMGYAFQQFIVNPLGYLLVFFPLKKIGESQRILYGEYKRYRRKRKRKKLKKEFDAILNTPHEKELDAYIFQREKDIQGNILISNDPNYPSAFHNYTEGKNYQIGNEEIVYHPLYRPEPLDLENYIQKNLVEHVQELTEIQVLYIISGDYWHHAVEYK